MGALSRGGQAWLELVVGGEALSPRERLVAVPFALRAGVAESVKNKPESLLLNMPNITLQSDVLEPRQWKRISFIGGGRAVSLNKGAYFQNLDIYIPKKTQTLVVRIADEMNYWNHRINSGGNSIISGQPILAAFVGKMGVSEFTMVRFKNNEFQLNAPPSGWVSVWLNVRGLEDTGKPHNFWSRDNKIAILVK